MLGRMARHPSTHNTLRAACLAAAAASLAACAGGPSDVPGRWGAPQAGVAAGAASPSGAGGHRKIGRPYQVNGVWYAPSHQPDYHEVGVASWYGPGFHGRDTANGERFDQNSLTAAHTTLPLPSMVRVTNLENGRTLDLRVNDRGPFAKGRILDVSRAAAQRLGFHQAGTARVAVSYLGPAPLPGEASTPPARSAPTPETRQGSLYIQVAALRSGDRAEALADRLSAGGPVAAYPARSNGRRIYRVMAGPWPDRRTAEEALEALRELGYRDATFARA